MLTIKSIASIDGSFVFNIKGDYTCISTKNVVYLFECGDCYQRYIGETMNSFRLQFNNHKSHSKSLENLPITRHVTAYNHSIRNFKVAILKSGFHSQQERRILESIMIKKFKTIALGLNMDLGILNKLL